MVISAAYKDVRYGANCALRVGVVLSSASHPISGRDDVFLACEPIVSFALPTSQRTHLMDEQILGIFPE